MRRYDSYNNSGIEWIGEIPSHWEIKKFSAISYMKGRIGWQGLKQTEFTKNQDEPFLITGMNFQNGTIRWDEVYHIPLDRYDEAPEIQLKNSDVLITKDGTIGKLLFVNDIPYPHKASLNSHLLVLRPLNKAYEPRYIYFQLQSLPFKHHVELTKTGTTFFGITQEAMGNYKTILPSSAEQTAIASYLDRKTAEIDQLIADKKRLLELYEEEKTAIINQAVTKGINPDVPMKDSGIEWLGEVPKHWEMKKLRYLCKITTGAKDTENKEDFGEYPFYVRSQMIERISSYSFDGEGILTAGDGVGVCKVWHYVNEKFDFHQRVYLMYDFQKIAGKLLFYYIRQNFIHDVLKLSAKSTVDSLRRNMFLDFIVTFPADYQEQNNITHYIETECNKIEIKIVKTQKLIDLLKEYRTALISEVVTGKVKVSE